MKLFCSLLFVGLIGFASAVATAQDPAKPVTENSAQSSSAPTGSPMDIYTKDVGTWETKILMWTGEAEPTESMGTETNKMVGDFWLVSDFSAQMMGAPFTGHGVFGYDEKNSRYTGVWVDDMNPNPTNLIGHYDAATKTMTFDGEVLDPSGNVMKSKLTTTYHDDGTHVMTMFAPNPDGSDGMLKVMEVHYKKK